MTVQDEVLDIVRQIEGIMANVGVTAEEADGQGYAIDFNNDVLADPYLFGTGYLPTRKMAETMAAMVLSGLDALANVLLLADPDTTYESLAGHESWARIVSAERDKWDEPVYEENFWGDAWLVAGAAMPHTLTDEERALLDQVRIAIEEARPRAKEDT